MFCICGSIFGIGDNVFGILDGDFGIWDGVFGICKSELVFWGCLIGIWMRLIRFEKHILFGTPDVFWDVVFSCSGIGLRFRAE